MDLATLPSALVGFALTVLAIPLALWLLKRSPLGARLGTGTARSWPVPARLINRLPVGPQQQVLTLEVGQGEERRWLIVGVTTHGMQTLHTLNRPPAESLVPPPAPRAPVVRLHPQR